MPSQLPLKIHNLSYRGDLEKERLILMATRSIEKGSQFLIFDNTFDDAGEVSNHNRHLYCLKLRKEVLEGELVVIYSKTGRFKNRADSVNNQCHFYFWGLGSSVWNKDEDEIVHIVDASQIKTKKFDAQD